MIRSVFMLGFYFFTSIGSIATAQKAKLPESPTVLDLSTISPVEFPNSVLRIGDGELMYEECKLDLGCDCCSDGIYLNPDSSFLQITYCVADISVLKGSWVLDGIYLRLLYEDKRVDFEYDWESEVNGESEPEYSKTVIQLKCWERNFSLNYCSDGYF